MIYTAKLRNSLYLVESCRKNERQRKNQIFPAYLQFSYTNCVGQMINVLLPKTTKSLQHKIYNFTQWTIDL